MKAAAQRKSESPKLSVVVASVYTGKALERCLNSILAGCPDGIEFIAVDRCSPEKTAACIDKFPAVDLIHFPEGTPLPIMLGAAIVRAKGEIIAITDSTCVADRGWAASILEAHRTDAPIIGGAVEMSGKAGLTDWSAYFCDYGQFIPPASKRVVRAVSGNNLSIKRRILNQETGFDGVEFWKSEWCRQLQSEGVELVFDPDILVRQEKEYKLLPFLSGRFHKGRCFAGRRSANRSILHRLFYAGGSFLLPFVFVFRTLNPVLGKRRHLGKLFLSLPVIVSATIFWSIGEIIGHLAGAGRSCPRAD